MAYHIQSSFSAGELDPALHERTTFDKYKTGLKTLRNTVIGKTGRMINRPGLIHHIAQKSATASATTFTADAGTDTCTTPGAHGFGPGTKVQVSSTGTLPAGLAAATDYYVYFNTATTFLLYTTRAQAIYPTGAAVNITGAGVGTHTVTPVDQGARRAILFSPPYSKYLVEWGHQYVKIHDTDAGTTTVDGHEYTEDDLDYIQFAPSGDFVYIFRYGMMVTRMFLGTLTGSGRYTYRFTKDFGSTDATKVFRYRYGPSVNSSTLTGTGYRVDYAFTSVSKGQESSSDTSVYSTAGTLLPIAVTERNILNITVSAEEVATASEIRVYRRPYSASGTGAFGYIGSCSCVPGVGTGEFVDTGADADYTHQPPSLIIDNSAVTAVFGKLCGKTGTIYQQRLLVTEYPADSGASFYVAATEAEKNKEVIYASRPGFLGNFYRDYPLSSDSSLAFKCGTTGNAQVLRLLDNGGLLAFTTVGIYQSSGALSPDNLAMDKKANYVIDERVPPLEVPGGVLFVDKSTNTVRQLVYSDEAGGYPGEEISIFSNHLFQNKRVRSWAFQDGDIPLVWVVFDDGSLVALTYQREHMMQAWSRHDSSEGLFESVAVVRDMDSANSTVYFIVNRDGTRYIEYLSDRFFDDIKDYVGMDSAVTYKSLLSDGATVVATVKAGDDDWTGTLVLTSDTAIFSNSADLGAVGTVFRHFDADGAAVDLTVTAYTSTTEVEVTPSVVFPQEEAGDVLVYRTYKTLTGLSHLEGKDVSISVDGYVVGSPYNDVENYTVFTVASGQITLPGDMRGAFVHVGLPYVCDIETLDIDTVEQKPTLLESRLVGKLYMKVHNTRGLFVGASFPELSAVQGMEDLETRTEDIEIGIIGNACQQPQTKRYEVAVPNDWDSNGRVCIRQVDPLPFEILSIIPDLHVMR